jgi:hypothetical protein
MFVNKKCDVPQRITDDHQAIEVLRIWISGNSQVISINSRIWNDPAAWGILIADLVRDLSENFGDTAENSAAYDRIKEALEAELEHPT